MDKERLTLEIPYGMRDFLPTEAAEKRAIEAELAAGELHGLPVDREVAQVVDLRKDLPLVDARLLARHLDDHGARLALVARPCQAVASPEAAERHVAVLRPRRRARSRR